jgi:type III pantothenate kinase
MLLAVDIGNSRTKFGVFDGNSLLSKWSIPTKDVGSPHPDVDGEWHGQISSAIACSVVPSVEPGVASYVKENFDVETRFVRNTDDLGITICHQPIGAIGTDRVIGSVFAAEKFGTPCIVISFGTATTIDVVNERRELMGGLIAAGIATSAKTLALNTAKLPEVEIVRPDGPMNVTTETAIQAGLFYSQVGLVETVVDRIGKEVSGATVIATGGFAGLIAAACRSIDVIEDDLVLNGLNHIWQGGQQQ